MKITSLRQNCNFLLIFVVFFNFTGTTEGFLLLFHFLDCIKVCVLRVWNLFTNIIRHNRKQMCSLFRHLYTGKSSLTQIIWVLFYSCGDPSAYMWVRFALFIFSNDCLFTIKSTHLIYLQKFSDLVNEAANSTSRKREMEKYSNVLSSLFYRNMPKPWVKCFGTE